MDIDTATDDLLRLVIELHDLSSQPHAQIEARRLSIRILIQSAKVYGWYQDRANGPD